MISAIAPTYIPSLSAETHLTLVSIAGTIRCLSMDAVHHAGSGHAGTPMGCADIAAYLYGCFLRHNPKNYKWVNRDRFILSNGHASLLQYTCLHLSGFPLSMDQIKQFRRLHSKTPSHPEYGVTEGVETTTGVDGQGIAHGVGQALGLKLLEARFNRKPFSIFNAKVVVLAGDGCFMEGISHEASALAGHLNLDNLILIYDRNRTCLDGLLSDSTSEDTMKRYLAYGWEVYEMDGHDFADIHRIFSRMKQHQAKPALIIANTIIGKGSPTKAGSYMIHSNPVGDEERAKAKKCLGFPDREFFVPDEVYAFFKKKVSADVAAESDWQREFERWSLTHPDLHRQFQSMMSKTIPDDIEEQLRQLKIPNPVSGRRASHYVLNYLGDLLPGLYGGSADLARSDMTHMVRHSVVTHENFLGKNIKYGVREFGMGGIAIGLAQTDMIIPFVGTFLAFSDYMLSAVRMAALMRLPVVYQFTHDSFFIGQDGPTHQPIEHLIHLRAIPNLNVIRPADANEVRMAWIAALRHRHMGPTAIVLSRQDLPLCEGTDKRYEVGLGRGAYVIKDTKRLDYTLIATGSEVSLALVVSKMLTHRGYGVRVVSMPSWELFDVQSEDYQTTVLGKPRIERISLEAGIETGWHKYVLTGKVIGLSTFGKSGRSEDLAKEFGFTPDQVVERILQPRMRSAL